MNRRFLALLAALLPGLAGAQEAAPVAAAGREFIGELSLVRYDLPRGRSDGFAPTRELARHKDEKDAIEWPEFTLNGRPIFRTGAEEKVTMRLRQGSSARSLFQLPDDDVIQPGNHWLRPVQWLRERKHLYTADRTARCGKSSSQPRSRYELWLFPMVINGEGGPVIKNVVLKSGGSVVFQKNGPWRSLTLLLPANERGKQYELTVDGRPAVKFDAGLLPVKLGNPIERVFPVNATVPGEGPRITVMNLARPGEFPHLADWEDDLAALSRARSDAGPPSARSRELPRPRSPMLIYAAALPHGMSGGFWKKGMNADLYAQELAAAGFEAVFEQVSSFAPPGDAESIETRAAAFARHGLWLGLQYDYNWTRPSFHHPNLAFFAHTLPEWHAPLYRSLQLTAQRLARLPNFLGINIGADNAGYAPYWPWAPPNPDRPWSEALVEFAGEAHPKVPRPPTLGPPEFTFEEPVRTQADFIKHVERYDTSFRQYGYFAEAVREIDPRLAFTTGSFGSSPGAAARGGWPEGSIPGRVMYEGLKIQQVYDWNQTHSSKPLHNVALIDRMRSYYPPNQTWALIDNFKLFFGREAMQRAYALALTRGVQGVGTNFLASSSGENARPEVVATQRELHDWIHRFGGVYAITEPEAVIGVFYSHLQAVQRRTDKREDAPAEALLRGSHEGKVTEALWLCHAAGWSARVITFQEVMRGPLPASMKAILLVGLDQPDNSWFWAPGLDQPLKQFLERGGRILADDESVSPVPATSTGLKVAAYVTQSELDSTPRLLARNRENLERLRTAMTGVPAPIAASESPLLWTIPTRAGDTTYVTAVNWGFAEGEEAKEQVRPPDPRAAKPEVWKTKANASLYVKPQTGALRWQTDRPIYDVRLQRRLTREEAAVCDLTKDGFRWYALPAAPVAEPEVAVARGASGFHEATVTMKGGAMTGIPIAVTVTRENAVTVHGVTGNAVRLPLETMRGAGAFQVKATELLSGLSTEISYRAASERPPSKRSRDEAALIAFRTRRHVPLTIALTAAQEKETKLVEAARALAKFYAEQGRRVRVGKAAPGDVVESLQPWKTPHRYPQWKTINSDLVLFGLPSNNVLVLDQWRGELFPREFSSGAGRSEILYTRSPFVGEYDAVNVIGGETASLVSAAARLMQSAPAPTAAR